MAEKNVVREDVVSISFDIEDDGLKEVQEMMKELKKIVKDAAGGTDKVIEELTEGFDEAGDTAKEATKEISKGLKDVEKVIKDTGQEASKTTKETKKETETLSKGLKSNLVNGLKSVKSSMASIGGKVVDTASKFKNFVNTKFDKLINGLKKFNKAADESKNKVKELEKESAGSEKGSGIKGTVAKAAGALAVGATLKNAITSGMNFEAGMSTVKAVSGANDFEMEKLTAKAEEMGRTTVFSASEAAEALNYMAMAGWKSEQMIGGIGGIMNLAAASGEDLGTTSDIVTDALTAFGRKADEAADFADVLAVASSNANTNVSEMGETFKYVAPVAGALKYDYKDVAAAIGVMANSGTKASQAGTSLRALFTRLTTQPKEAAAAMKKLGLSLVDSKGKMKSFREVMIDMRKSFSKYSEIEKTAYAKMLAGTNGYTGLLSIVNATNEDFDKVMNAVNNAKGAAEEMANIKIDNLSGQIKIFMSGVEGIYNEFYKHIKEPLKKFVVWITENIVPKITSGIQVISTKLSPVFKNIIPIIKEVIESIALKFEWFKTNILPSLIEGFNTIKAAVVPVIETIIQKVVGLFDRIFGLLVQNKDVILNAWNNVCGLFTYFTDSILPEVVNVFNWVVQTIMPMVSDIINIGSQLVQEAVPFIKEIVGDVIDVVKGIAPVVKGIVKAIVNVVKTVAKNIESIIPILKLVAKGYLLVKGAMLIFKGVVLATNAILKIHTIWLKAVDIAETIYIATLYAAEAATKVLNAVIAAGPWGWLATAIGIAATALFGFMIYLDDTDEELEKNQEKLRETASKVVTLQEALKNTTVQPIQFDKLITADGLTFEDINTKIDEAEAGITEILKKRFSEQQALREEDIKNIQNYNNTITELEKKKFDVYNEQMEAQRTAIELIKPGDKNAIGDAMAYLNNASDTKEEALKETDALYQRRLAEINNKYQKADKIIDDKGKTYYKQNELDAAKKAFEDRRKLIEEQYKLTSDSVEKLSSDIIKKGKSSWSEVEKVVKAPVYANMAAATHQEEITKGEAFEGVRNKRIAYSKSLGNIDENMLSSINQVLGLSAKLKESNGEITQTLKDNISNYLGYFDGLDDDMQEIGKDTLLGMIRGLEETIPGLEDTSSMSCQEIVNTIKGYLGIHSPSRVMAEIGGNIIQGLQVGIMLHSAFLMLNLVSLSMNIANVFKNINLYSAGQNIMLGLKNGILNQKEKLVIAVRTMAQELNNTFKSELEIHSPSRVMRYNGQMVGEGLALGMDDKMSDIQSSFDNFDMSMGYTPENSGISTTNQNNTENNNISPVFNITVYGNDEGTAERTKENIEDIFERMFEGYSRKSPRLTEV